VNQPPLAKMLEKASSKYALVVVAAKRARQITEAGTVLVGNKAIKPVTIALHEIAEGKTSFKLKI